MPAIPNKSYLITLNKKPLCVVYSNGYYACGIMEEMRIEHFEEVYGLEISAQTTTLEEQYEKEYTWDYEEIDSLSTQDAEKRYLAIMQRKALADEEVEAVALGEQ